MVFLVSHLMFDGEIMKKKCVYTNGSEVLVNRVQEHLGKICSRRPHVLHRRGLITIRYGNSVLADFLYQKSKELVGNIDNLPPELQRAFLRSFFDDEGCISYEISRKERRVRGYQQDLEILYLIQKLLRNFGIESVIREKSGEIVVSRRENLIRFREQINFSPGVYINGLRKNSVHKKSLEKRKLLDMAIDSYQQEHRRFF